MIMLTSLYCEWRTNTIHFMNTNLVEQPSSYLHQWSWSMIQTGRLKMLLKTVAAVSLPFPPNTLPPKTQIPQVSRGHPGCKSGQEGQGGKLWTPCPISKRWALSYHERKSLTSKINNYWKKYGTKLDCWLYKRELVWGFLNGDAFVSTSHWWLPTGKVHITYTCTYLF